MLIFTRNLFLKYLHAAAVVASILVSACSSSQYSYTPSIGILIFDDSHQPQVDGFIDGLTDLGYYKNLHVIYRIKHAKKDFESLSNNASQLIEEDVDLLVAAGGVEADVIRKLLKKNRKQNHIPVIALSSSAVVERGLINSRRNPGWNVTGVDNLNAELSGKRLAILKELIPNLGKVVTIYSKNSTTAALAAQNSAEIAKKMGISVTNISVSSWLETKSTMESIQLGEFDAMLVVPNTYVEGILKDIILPHAQSINLPVMAYSKHQAEMGALASYGTNDHEVGIQSARLARKIIQGIEAKNIPFEVANNFSYVLNNDVRQSLNIGLSLTTKSQVDEYILTKN